MPAKYLDLARYWAPHFVAASKSPVDWPTRFNGDGDWILTNNSDNFDRGKFSHFAFVYYDVFETENAYALVYTVYNVRDEKKPIRPLQQLKAFLKFFRWIPWEVTASHQHDSEGVVVYIEKDGSEFGNFRFVLTKAHSWLIPYAAGDELHDELTEYDRRRSISPWWAPLFRVNSVDGYMKHINPYAARHHRREEPLLFIENMFGRHPVILIGPAEEGHGHYKYNPKVSNLARLEGTENRKVLLPNSGMVYFYTGRAKDPSHTMPGMPIGYDLLPTVDTIVSDGIRSKKDSNWLEEMATRFLLTEHKNDFVPLFGDMKPFMDLPRFFAAVQADQSTERGSNPFWAWLDYEQQIGIDPIGFLYRRLPQIASKLVLSKRYFYNAYAEKECYQTGAGCSEDEELASVRSVAQ